MKGRLWWVFPCAVLSFCLLVVLLPAALIEAVFSRGIFVALQWMLGKPVSWLPFSLTEVLVLAALPALGIGIALLVRRLRRAEHRRAVWMALLRRTLCVAAAVLLLYMLLHGVNFYRLPTDRLLGYDVTPADAKQLYAICLDLSQKASQQRENLAEDERGCMRLQGSLSQLRAQAVQGYDALQAQYPFLSGAVRQVKAVQLSHWWSYTGITGMYFPLLAEANINIDAPACFMPATAAHELAHTRGFAREDECNFWAYRTCIAHPEAQFRYAGYLLAFVHCANAYYAYDAAGYRELYQACSDAVRRDLAANAAYWEQFKGPVRQLSESVNDAFLTVQGQQSGVLAYGEMVRLVVGHYRSEQIL